ncbi:unnamed protein product, partial [Musa textilis]
VVSTKRTILSPFTKEYRVHATQSSIRQFLEGFFSSREGSQQRLNQTNGRWAYYVEYLSFGFLVAGFCGRSEDEVFLSKIEILPTEDEVLWQQQMCLLPQDYFVLQSMSSSL